VRIRYAQVPAAIHVRAQPVSRPASSLVYHWCMTRTNIDIDDEACSAVMARYHLGTKRDAVNFALRTLAVEPLSLDDARHMRGSGWDGDLEEMRKSRAG
jgi:Arc/MetJ family transcription regulator